MRLGSLTYTITADAQQAERGNASVEAGLQRVEVQAKKTAAASQAAHQGAAHGAKVAEDRIKALEKTWREQDKAREAQWRNEEQRLRAQGKQTDALGGQIKTLAKTMATVFAVDMSLGFVRGLTESAKAIRDQSAALGLSARTFQTFSYAVERGGGTVNDMTTALAQMSKNLVGGPTATVNALRSLNLDIDQLKRLAPDAAFLAIADAIRDNTRPMEQMQAAVTLFGETGRKILPAIQKDFRMTAEEAARLGLVIEDDNVQALATFEDRWKRAEVAIKTSISNILGALFQLYDAADRWFAGADGEGNWARRSARALIDQTPLALLYADSSTAPDSWRRTVLGQGRPDDMPGAPGDPRAATGGAFDTSRYSGLEIPPAVTTSTRDLTSARRDLVHVTRDAIAADREYLRGLTTTIGVNRTLQLDPSHPFAQTGIAGALTGIDMRPPIPSSNPLQYTGLAPSLTSGFGGYRPTPATGGGFWSGRGGQVVGAGIGIAGGAAMGAMAGGDPYASMIGGAASAMGGAALAGTITSTVALGAATMGIGAAAVGIYMLAKHFTTVSKEVKQARVDIENFQQELWKTASAAQMNEAAGQDWAATVIVVRDAYGRMGKSAADAERDVAQLFDDAHPERAREAMQKITNVMQDLQRVLSEANVQMGTLLGQASQLATRLPQSLLDQLTALVDRGDLTDGNAALVRQLQDASAIDFDQFKSRADALGLDPDALGSVYAQHRTTSTAQQYIDDIDLFTKGGVDMGTILSGMRQEISGLVQEAMKFGTEIPKNMQPFIQNLFDTGQLLDENGDKMEDISGLKWGEPLKTSTDKLIDSIQELINTLNGPLQAAFGAIPSEVRTRISVDRSDLPDPGERQRHDGPESDSPFRAMQGGVVPQYLASGGVAGLFQPRYTDTVPAMLTPGEGVLSRRGMAMLGRLNGGQNASGMDAHAIGRAMAQELARSGGLRPVVHMDRRIVTEEIASELGDALEYQGIQGPTWRR